MGDAAKQNLAMITSPTYPLVSTVLAVRNEERYIEAVLRSLLRQDTPNFALEIIVVDGDSSDSTGEIVQRVAAADPRVKLAINRHEKTPCAFNLGIESSQGEYVCILGAHTTYATNYIAACLEDLRRLQATGCSGCIITRPGDDGLQAQLIAWALAHSFGTSTGSMRTRGAGFADSIPYPLFLKSALLEVGGYNPRLHRNQDNDLNQRLRARGHKLYITDKTSCKYFVSSNVAALFRYAIKAGRWSIISLKQNSASMSVRHFVPGAFVLLLLISLLTFLLSFRVAGAAGLWLRIPLFGLAITYGCASIVAATHIAVRERTLSALLTPIFFLVLHISYGAGTLTAAFTNAVPPPFDPEKEPSFRRTSDLIENR